VKLSAFDDKYVRVTDKFGDIFDGLCMYNSDEYMLAEYGREEEALQIDHWLFYRWQIETVALLPEGAQKLWLGKPMHEMRLAPKPFRLVEAGKKTVELRLNDEKRRKLRVGDVIRFEKADEEDEVLHVFVRGLHPFKSFSELYCALPLEKCGYLPEELAHASPEDMNIYYSEEEQRRWGVLGIEIELI
jgi:ASC-1-like (ASCH) protein